MSNDNDQTAKQIDINAIENGNAISLNDNPSPKFMTEAKVLAERISQLNLPLETFQELLSEAMARFLEEPKLHWWCHPDLRPIAIELLHIFSLDENNVLEQFKNSMEHMLGACLDCTESYLQDRRIYLSRLLKQYDKDVVDTFFRLLLNWDRTRLENRLQALLAADPTPNTQKLKKITICELLLDPSLLLLPDYSKEIPGLLSTLLNQMLQLKKIKIMSVLPGLWLLALHQDVVIQSWAAYTTNVAASGDSLVPERWTGWEQFSSIWGMALEISSDLNPTQYVTSIPLSNDSARMWRSIRAMLASMGRDVIILAINRDNDTWRTLRSRLLGSIQDPETSPAVFIEICRVTFHLLGNLKQEFWRAKGEQYLESLSDAEEILRSVLTHPGTLEYISTLAKKEGANKDVSSTQALTRTYAEYTTWISNFINSLSGAFDLSKVLMSVARTLLSIVSNRISSTISQTTPGMSTDQNLSNIHLEYDLELLNIVFQLLGEQQKESTFNSMAETLSAHWNWLVPICALGPQAIGLSDLAVNTVQRIKGLATRASIAGRKITTTLLDHEAEFMWHNYTTATSTVKSEQVSELRETNPSLWLYIAQATSSMSSLANRNQLDDQGKEHLMEWQTVMIEQFSKISLLPKLETKQHFSQTLLSMSNSFNNDMDLVFRASSVILQCLANQGEIWLKMMINNENKRFLVKVLRLWSSPDPETRTQALFIMRSAWQEVTRPACLRLAYQIGGEQSIGELNEILVDFRTHGSPGGATPPALFELLLDSVTTLFLNNPIDGEGGLYLQIFLDLISSQEVARHLSLIKKLWDSIWMSMKAAFLAGRTIWADRQDRGETIRTMKLVANVGLLIIGKIRYFERLLEFEKQDIDNEVQDQDLVDGFWSAKLNLPSSKETMPLDAMKDGLERMADWTFAQDTTLCSSAIELVCAVLNLLADHNNTISDHASNYLTKIAEGSPKIKSLLTTDQREILWISLSRHVAYQDNSNLSLKEDHDVQESKPTLEANTATPSSIEPIEISDDDFGDIGDIDLAELDFDDDNDVVQTSSHLTTSKDRSRAPTTETMPSLRSDFFHRVTSSNNPFQTKLKFTPAATSGGIPAGGSTTRRLPSSLSRLNLNISQSSAKSTPKPAPIKKGHKLSQMRADHRKERSNIIQATKDARMVSKVTAATRPLAPSVTASKPSESESESESDSDDGNNGLNSLVDTEVKWNNRNKTQEPRKTKLLDLQEIMGPNKFVDTVAIRRQKALEDAQRQHRLMPNLSALHAQILKWEVSAKGDRPPGDKDYAAVPPRFDSVNEYIKAFEPLLVLECWQQLMGAREEVNQSSDSVIASFVNRVSIDNFQDTHMKIPLDKASSLMVEDIVVISDPNVKDVFTAVGNATRPKPFFAKVQSITKAKGLCEVVFRTCLKIEESSPLMFMRPQSSWSILKMLNLTTTHREYAALAGMRYYELCDDVLDPPDEAPRKPSQSNIQHIIDTFKVNTPQAQAIVGAIEKPKGFTLIQGPPGTGKTKTILGLVGALLADNSRLRSAPVVQPSRNSERPLQTGTVGRILVCAPSNAAIDEIVKRLMSGIRNMAGEVFIPKVVRIGTLETVNMEVKDVALDTLIAKELESASTSKDEFQSAAQSVAAMREKMRQLQQDLEKARLELVEAKDANNPMLISNAQSKVKAINKSKWQLGQELDTARSNQEEASQKKDQARKDARNKILGEADVICSTLSASGHDLLTSSSFSFETVIIDEAAQSVEISSLIPLKFGCKRCILVGDPNQLPPTVISQLAAKYAYNQSLFVRIQNLAPHSVHLLSIQYRMHPDISAFPSREFYKSLLKDGPGMADKTRAEWHNNPILSPYRFFDVYQGQEQIGLSHSQHNPIEAEAAVALLEGLCNSNPTLNFFRRVGVISPYKQQVRTLKEYFQRAFDKSILEAVDFNTVDGFQGQEKDIIIFSCVRASSYGSVGFLADIRRMNVALTRARQSLFILGHADTLRREAIWGDLVRDAESRDMFTKVTPGVFGRRGATAPRNILQPKLGTAVDRRNELYGRAVDQKHATAIENPMDTIEDIMEVAFYPTLPMTSADAGPINSRSFGNDSKRETQNQARRGQNPEPVKKIEHVPDSRLQGNKRRQDDLSDSVSRLPTNRNHVSTRNPSPPRSTNGTVSQPSTIRPPSPKRAKASTSLFLKSKPMSMKKSNGPSKQYDIPTRERLAAQVIPIRKSYPSGSNAARPAVPVKRPTGPSIDDILGTMNEKSRD